MQRSTGDEARNWTRLGNSTQGANAVARFKHC